MSFRVLALMLLLGLRVWAQEPPPSQKAKQPGFPSMDLNARDYRLGPGDLLEIAVFGVTDFKHEVRVSSSGTITLPFLGRIMAEGFTGEELEKRLRTMLSEQKLVRDPQVSIFIKDYRSQPVYVLGAVNTPGQYMISHQLRLLDAISMAGGVDTKRADDFLILQRRLPGHPLEGVADGAAVNDSKASVMQIDLKKLLENGDVALNIGVQGGDVIQVPERKIEVFYVVGEVGRAGAFEFPKDKGKVILASQALAWAGGGLKTAKMGQGMLIRYDRENQPKRININFSAIFKGKRPDFPVQPNDIIFVPGSTVKTLGYGLLGVIPGTIASAIIWRGPF